MAKWLKLKGEEEVSDFNKENVKKTHEEVPFTKPYHFHVSDIFYPNAYTVWNIT